MAGPSSRCVTRYSVCPYNCWPVNCGIAVTTMHGDIVEIRGNPHHDLSRGMLCVKGQSCGEIHQNDHRVLYPLKRDGPRGGNRWKRIGWEEALDTIADGLRRNLDAGHPEANAVYHSHGNIVQRVNWKVLTPRFANMVGATLWDGDFPCWYDVGLAQELTGYLGLHDPVEMGGHARTVVNWAQDACASEANIVPYLIQVRERGGTVVTIDPRTTQTAALSDFHIRPRLGSDVWLANAVAHILIREGAYDASTVEKHCHGFDRYRDHIQQFTPEKAAKVCEIPRAEIDRLAGLYAENKPLCTNLSRGALGKHWNGVQMVRAVLCLIPLSGNLAVRGGGAIWGESIEWNLDLCAKDRRPAGIPYPVNNFNAIDDALERGVIDTFLVVGGNPMSQWPHLNRLRAQLMKVRLIVVFDLFINHTAREVGDIILPATSWLEELGLRTSNTRIYLMDRIAEPRGECREAGAWMRDLAARLGKEDYFPWPTKAACLDDCLKSIHCRDASVEELKRRPDGIPAILPEIPYSDFTFSSPTKKFELYSNLCEKFGLPPLPSHEEPVEGILSTPERAKRYPRLLVSARRNSHCHSFHDSHREIGTLHSIEKEPVLWVHPTDAFARGLVDGDHAAMFNDRGRGLVKVEITTEVPQGLVSLNDCWPELNVVTDKTCPVDPKITAALNVGGQPSYQNVLVEITKAPARRFAREDNE